MGTQDSRRIIPIIGLNKRNQSPIGIFDILSDNHFWGHFMTCIDHPRIIAWNWCEMGDQYLAKKATSHRYRHELMKILWNFSSFC